MLLFKNVSIPYALCVVLSAASCSTQRFYSPTTAHVPMMNRRNYTHLSGSICSQQVFKNLQADLSWSPLPYFGLAGYYSGARFKKEIDPRASSSAFHLQYDGQNYTTGASTGAYWPFGHRKNHVVSLFAGGGTGRTNIDYYYANQPKDRNNANWRQTRWFVQPAVGFAGRQMQGGGGLRFVWLNYTNGRVNYNIDPAELFRISQLPAWSPVNTTELFCSFGWHWRFFTLDLEYTSVLPTNATAKRIDLTSQHFSLTLGMNVHDLLFRKVE